MHEDNEESHLSRADLLALPLALTVKQRLSSLTLH
jgi:hypothetical protein